MKLDILAFGAHPDDVELSCSGLLLIEKMKGKKIGVIDLTEGELGSRGSVKERYDESKNAADIIGMDCRENLQMPDGFFTNSKENQLKVIQTIRKYKPEIILCNALSDRHPDHGKGGQLVSDAAFLSGLIKIETSFDSIQQDAWRPKYIFHYIQDRYIEPTIIFDITAVFDKKLAAIQAYKTQFYSGSNAGGPSTYISSPVFMEQLISVNKIMGKKIGVEYGEGYTSSKNIGLKSIDSLIIENT